MSRPFTFAFRVDGIPRQTLLSHSSSFRRPMCPRGANVNATPFTLALLGVRGASLVEGIPVGARGCGRGTVHTFSSVHGCGPPVGITPSGSVSPSHLGKFSGRVRIASKSTRIAGPPCDPVGSA